MALDLNDLNERASALSLAGVPNLTGIRTLLVDGDAICYYCAGNEDTSVGEARAKAREFINAALRRSESQKANILVTGDGSNKGGRYAVARAKPYQGHRTGSNRPKNWAALRDMLMTGVFDEPDRITTTTTHHAEADDLFANLSVYYPGEYVIFTQDKDLRMVPGIHMTWPDMLCHFVPRGTWSTKVHDKVYGEKWFWLQMLHGDTADNIPGLPGYYDGIVKSGANRGNPKLVKVGEKTAEDLLRFVANRQAAQELVLELYQNYYGAGAELAMLEQGILLWMRPNPGDVLDVAAVGHPLEFLRGRPSWTKIEKEIRDRLNVPQAQDDRDCQDPGAASLTAGLPVCNLQATSDGVGSSTGPRPLDGGSTSDPAPGLQRPPWED